jgi:putative spermidine/putrescine transport system ATP-binding protein
LDQAAIMPDTSKPASDAGKAIVRLSNVRKTYRHVVAVERVDLDIRRGEFFTLLGPSGSGKTTTLRLIAGFETQDTGVIELDGKDVSSLPPFERDINTVFQDYALFPHMSVGENIAYGLEAKRVPKIERERRTQEALAMVRLESFGNRKPAQLSGGQRQRVGLARAIVNRPSVLLLDEPLGALDLKLRQEMQYELKRIQAEVGITFIYVTHDQEEALTMSDRIAVFEGGRIAQIGTPEDVYERPANEFVAGFVGTSNILNRQGRRVLVRPEKIQVLAADAMVESAMRSEPGRVKSIVYVGMFTRLVIELADKTEILAVRQNLNRYRKGEHEETGQSVLVAWHPENEFELPRNQ